MRRVGIILLLFTLACARTIPPASNFVTCRGATVARAGRPLRFIGVNCYSLANNPERAGAVFQTLTDYDIHVVRFWAFQSFCGPSGRDFRAFDQIFAAAKRHDVLLIPVLENHWSDCTDTPGEPWKPPAWYARGWLRDKYGGAPLSYREYLTAMGSHFRLNPQILAWQLVNEPEIYPDTPASFTTLRHFAESAARELKHADPHHLVALGVLGIGQPGTTGDRFRELHALPDLDVVTAHDHGYIYEALAGRNWPQQANSFYADLRDAQRLGKPFVATESGIALERVQGDRVKRAELLQAKLRAFFAAGGTGYILWNYEPVADTNFGFGPDDPILPMIRETAGEELW